jgi:hypothetical protein
MSKSALLDELRREFQPKGLCLACERPLPPRPPRRKKRVICGDVDCLSFYNSMHALGRRVREKHVAPIQKTCGVCGKLFRVQRYRENTARFCSKQCCGASTAARVLNTPQALEIRGERMRGNKFREGLTPSRSYVAGHTPWNKGLKGIHLSPGSEFKRGQPNTNPPLPIGAERSRPDKNGAARVHVKTAQPNTWRPRAQVVWERHRGPIPSGMLVHHVDHDSTNDVIDNLRLLTRSQHIAEHRAELRAAFTKSRAGQVPMFPGAP